MTVWIVLRNGQVDEVFDNPEAAANHYNNLLRKWNLVKILMKEVKWM